MSTRAIENYDHCLHFQVLDKRISFIDDDAAEVVADNRGCICINISFDEQWDGCGKTARFIYEGLWVDVVLDANNECICPSEVLKKGRFSLGVYGADLKTTTPIVVSVAESILSECEGEMPPAPTDDVYQQILQISADSNIAIDEATRACWDAVNSSNEAIEALNRAKQEMEDNGFITTIKEKHRGLKLGFWVGTTDEYEALPEKPKDCYVLLTDDKSMQQILERLNDAERKLNAITTSIVKSITVSGTTSSDGNLKLIDKNNSIVPLYCECDSNNYIVALYTNQSNHIVGHIFNNTVAQSVLSTTQVTCTLYYLEV